MRNNNPAIDPTLDGDAIRARRLEFGWSARTLADRLGSNFSPQTITSIELGLASRELTLNDIHRIAEFLQLSAKDVVVLGQGDPSEQVQDVSDSVFDQKVGAVLASLESSVEREELATALGTDLDTLGAALDRLSTTAPAMGLEVQQAGTTVRLAPAFNTAPAETVAALTRKQLCRDDMAITQVGLLSRTARGLRPKRVRDGEQVVKRTLMKAGLIEMNPSGGTQLTADAAFSLMMEAPG